jgi:hypothetical protein
MDPFSIVGLGLTAASTGMGLFNSLSGGGAAQTAANNQKHLALLEGQKYQLNAVLAQYEAQRIQDMTRLDVDYLGFATDRQAKWLAMSSELDKSIALGGIASKFVDNANEAKARAKDAKAIAEIQADNTEHTGERQSKQIAAQTNYKRVMQQEDDAKKLGLVRASAGARMVAYSGSALDVLAHEEAMANARQTAISVLGGMQADDVQYDSKIQANAMRQKASIQAQAEVRQFTTNPLDSPLLQAQLVKADIGTARDIALTNEEGWRVAMKMKMESSNAVAKTAMGMGDQMIRATSSVGIASAYSGQANAGTDWSKAGSSLLTGAASLFKEVKQSDFKNPFASTPVTPASSSGVSGSVRVSDNY